MSIYEQPLKLLKMHSIEAQGQGNEGTCYAHASARVITKLISRLLPKFFQISETEKNLLYDESKKQTTNKNCFISIESNDINNLRKILYPELNLIDRAKRGLNKLSEIDDYDYSKNKCPIKGKYNTLIMYFYTLFIIRREYGCSGAKLQQVLTNFISSFNHYNNNFNKNINNNNNDLYNLKHQVLYSRDGLLGVNPPKNGYIISKSVDDKCRIILNELSNFIATNNIYLKYKSVYFDLSANINVDNNWITNFPEDCKNAIKNKLYVILSFSLSDEKMNELIEDPLIKINDHFCRSLNNIYDLKKIHSHGVVITNWEKDERSGICYVTIINSWGNEWGMGGVVRIPSTLYNNFVLDSSCRNEKYRMSFKWINVYTALENKNYVIPYEFPSVQMGTRTRPKTLSEWAGGKTKKTKKRKNLNKRKSKKRN